MEVAVSALGLGVDNDRRLLADLGHRQPHVLGAVGGRSLSIDRIGSGVDGELDRVVQRVQRAACRKVRNEQSAVGDPLKDRVSSSGDLVGIEDEDHLGELRPQSVAGG